MSFVKACIFVYLFFTKSACGGNVIILSIFKIETKDKYQTYVFFQFVSLRACFSLFEQES